jgi:hypothetical protein
MEMSYVDVVEIEQPTTECTRCKLLDAKIVSLDASVRFRDTIDE